MRLSRTQLVVANQIVAALGLIGCSSEVLVQGGAGGSGATSATSTTDATTDVGTSVSVSTSVSIATTSTGGPFVCNVQLNPNEELDYACVPAANGACPTGDALLG